MRDNIIKLTKVWHRIINLRWSTTGDSRFYINQAWSYGEEPFYRVEYHGLEKPYIQSAKSYEEAETILYNLVNKLVSEQVEWSNRIINEGETRHDFPEINTAKMILEINKKINGK